MTINGLPLHPLVVHAAVVFSPMAGLCAIAYHWPSWRDKLRWPMPILAVVAAAAVWFAAATGDSLKHDRFAHMTPQLAHLVHVHETWAGRLQASMWVLAALSILAWWIHDRPGIVRNVLSVLLPLVAVAALVLVVLTGDAGAKAVWNG